MGRRKVSCKENNENTFRERKTGYIDKRFYPKGCVRKGCFWNSTVSGKERFKIDFCYEINL